MGRLEESDLNRPVRLLVGPLPSGEQQADYLLDIVARPKDEVHLLGATNNVLQELSGGSDRL